MAVSERPTTQQIEWLYEAYLCASGEDEQANAKARLSNAIDQASVATRLAVAVRLPALVFAFIGRHARSVWREESSS